MLFFYLFFTGCKNPCQQLCDEIEDFAQECGEEFSKDLQKECHIEYRWHPKEGKQACSTALPKLREEWTCDDIAVYFDDGDDLFSEEGENIESDHLTPSNNTDTNSEQ
ncbi:MAG: hypothetical protein CMK59_10700 [Proteobacteria bacterium]|nr:hypothetical protein [Pseudomonadota bacterium]